MTPQIPKYTGPYYVSEKLAHKVVTKIIEAVIVTGRTREFIDGDWQEEELQQIEAMVSRILDFHVSKYGPSPKDEPHLYASKDFFVRVDSAASLIAHRY